MRWSELFIPTLKETPAEAEAISHILMIRAGLIRKLAAGAYSYLPLGFRSLLKVQNIIRQEMNRAGALEVLLPSLQPAELWKNSGRFSALGEDMISFIDRHGNQMIMGPTHEEVITDLVKGGIRSYRDLPKILYQIQTKFRDEIRPRFGVIRSREFIMKDAYSFDRDWEGLDQSYQRMFQTYQRIFQRCGLAAVPVEAETGVMGGDVSHEFMVRSERGEDLIVQCEGCGYAASLEKAECRRETRNQSTETRKIKETLQKIYTPNLKTVEKVAEFLKVAPAQMIKTLIYSADGETVAVLVCGDHEVNPAKLQRFLKCQVLKLADAKTIERTSGAPVGFAGPIGLKEKIKMIGDWAIQGIENGVTGANEGDYHFVGVKVQEDFQPDQWTDIRLIKEGDVCPKCEKKVKLTPAIEVGHIFKLGTKYSKILGATFVDQDGQEKPLIMGCYGIGVNRILAAEIEQSHDTNGIRWPMAIAPFQIIIMPLNIADPKTRETAEQIYQDLQKEGWEVLFDDRDERAGVKFKDADLIGIPYQIVIGEKNLAQGKVEWRKREGGAPVLLDPREVVKTLPSHQALS